MLNSFNKIARIVGILFLIQIVIGVLINEVLLGPIVFGSDYLTKTSAHSSQIIGSMLLGFINGIIDIVIAVLLLPIFKKQSEILAYVFLAFSILGFITVTADNVSVQSLLALSKEYVKAGTPANSYFQTLGAVAYSTRLWTHLIIILVSGLPFSVFYYLLFKTKLVPRFISIWGFIATVMMVIAVLLMIFDRSSSMMLFIPMGLNQIFLAGWLIVKGFNLSKIVS